MRARQARPSVGGMDAPVKRLSEGAVTFAIGVVMWLFTGDIDTPVVTLSKVGIVLMVVGAAEAGYGLYQWRRTRQPT
jgi:Family of unknown function (DUF5708)